MKKTLNLLSFAVIVTGILITQIPSAFADHGGGHSGCKFMSKFLGKSQGDLKDIYFGTAHSILKNKENLGLTEDKVTAIKDMKHEMKKQIVTQKAEIEVVELEINKELSQSTIDEEKVNRLVDQKYDLKKTQTKNLVEALTKLKGMLTPEQAAQLKDSWGYKHKDKKHSDHKDKESEKKAV